MNENVGWAIAGAGATVVGGAIGAHRGQRAQRWFDEAIEADMNHLYWNGHLPPMPMPPAPNSRRLKHLGLLWVGGIALGGFLGWLTAALIVYALSAAADNSVQRGFAALAVGAFFGLLGFVVPGIPLALTFQLLEQRARLRLFEATVSRNYWERREALRRDLDAGRVTLDRAKEIVRIKYQTIDTY